MKILVVVGRRPVHRFLVEVDKDPLIDEMKKLISKNRHSEAMVLASTKGRFEKEVGDSDLARIKADLILQEETVSWDLM